MINFVFGFPEPLDKLLVDALMELPCRHPARIIVFLEWVETKFGYSQDRAYLAQELQNLLYLQPEERGFDNATDPVGTHLLDCLHCFVGTMNALRSNYLLKATTHPHAPSAFLVNLQLPKAPKRPPKETIFKGRRVPGPEANTPAQPAKETIELETF